MPLTLSEDTFRGYRDLAGQLAWKFWRALPPSAKAWIDPEDLVAHAYLSMVQKFPHYNDKFAGKTTFFYYVLSRELQNFVRSKRCKKRMGEVVPMASVPELGRPDAMVKQTEALYSLAQVYAEVSPKCRKEMKRWFGQKPVPVRRSEMGKRAMEEFRIKADKYRLTADDCRTLMRSGVCLP